MPVNSNFFPGALLEKVGNEVFLYNFGINKIILSFKILLLLI